MRGDPIVTINGKSFEVCNPDDPYWQWVKDGCFNHEWEIYDNHLKPEHTFVDIGAWIGSHSMYASGIANQIVCVEPDPIAYEILIDNLWKLGKITTAIRMAVGAEGELTLGSGCLGASTTRKNLAAGNNIGPGDVTTTVEAIPLRELIKELSDPLFIKMDIEGMEEEVFKEWELFRERKPSLFVEFHPWWWENEKETRQNFQRLSNDYKTVREVRPLVYFLEN